MGRGDPDFDTPQHIREAAKKAIDEGATHYTPIRGTIELRRAIADKLKRENNLDYNPDNEIVVTVGAEEAVFLTFYALINPGDEVIVPTPRYTSYDEAIKMWGGEIAVVPCEEQDEFTYNPGVMRKYITPRTKIISLVNPGNPLGLLGPDKVRAIADIALEHDLLVVSDEIYEKFIYDGTPHLSMAAIPGMKERCVTINGPSKAYAMTGWRCGFLAAPGPICEMLTEPAHTVAICCPAPTQAAALAAYTGPQDCVQQMKDEYDKRRRMMVAAADEMGFTYVPPRAGFYVYIDISSLGIPADDFCRRMLQEARVMAFPGTLFGDATKRFIRVGVLTPTERIALGIQRMKEFVAKVRKGG
jgi:aminotransferase